MRKTGYLLCADSQLLQQKEKLFPFFLRKRGEKSRELFSAGVFHFMPAFLPCFCQGNQHDPFIPFVSASEDKAIIFQLCKLLRKGLRTNGKMVCQCSLTYGLPFADKPKDTFPRKRRAVVMRGMGMLAAKWRSPFRRKIPSRIPKRTVWRHLPSGIKACPRSRKMFHAAGSGGWKAGFSPIVCMAEIMCQGKKHLVQVFI